MKKTTIFWEVVWVPQVTSPSPPRSQQGLTNTGTTAWVGASTSTEEFLPCLHFLHLPFSSHPLVWDSPHVRKAGGKATLRLGQELCRKPWPQLNVPLWTIHLFFFVSFRPLLYPSSHSISSSFFCHSTKLLIPKVSHKKYEICVLNSAEPLSNVQCQICLFWFFFFPGLAQV